MKRFPISRAALSGALIASLLATAPLAMASSSGDSTITQQMALKGPDNKAYQAFGKKAGITALINTFVGNVASDNRINFYFAHTNIKHLKKELVSQVCMLMGGPCTYTGRSMTSAHKGMGVTDSAFNALTEDMIAAMNKHHVPLSAQNQLIAALAPMKSNIVTH
jgi:Truncated hemoglobins